MLPTGAILVSILGGAAFRVQGAAFRVQGAAFRVQQYTNTLSPEAGVGGAYAGVSGVSPQSEILHNLGSLYSMDIKREIERLDPISQTNVLRALKDQGVPFTLNSNGYFFNLKDISEESRASLAKYIDTIKENKAYLEETDAHRLQCMSEYRDNIDKRILDKQEQFEKERQTKLKLVQDPVQLEVLKESSKVYIDPDILYKNHKEKMKAFTKRLPYCIRSRKKDKGPVKRKEADYGFGDEGTSDDIKDNDIGEVTDKDYDGGGDGGDEGVDDGGGDGEAEGDDDGGGEEGDGEGEGGEGDDDNSECESDKGDYDDSSDIVKLNECIFVSKETMDHYRFVLMESYNFVFEQGNHDMLVVQDYI